MHDVYLHMYVCVCAWVSVGVHVCVCIRERERARVHFSLSLSLNITMLRCVRVYVRAQLCACMCTCVSPMDRNSRRMLYQLPPLFPFYVHMVSIVIVRARVYVHMHEGVHGARRGGFGLGCVCVPPFPAHSPCKVGLDLCV